MIDATDLPLTADPQKMINQLARLVEISVTLNSTLQLEKLLEYIMDTAAELLDCEAASILLYDQKQNQLKFAATTGSSPKGLAGITVPLDNSIAGTIFEENKPLVINDVDQDDRHNKDVSERIKLEIRSLLGVPMAIKDQKVGVLEAINKNSSIFSYSDIKLLSIIASQAAVAINNARLVQELQEAYEQLSETDEMKSRFMAVASHELRTPLGIIMGYATFLKEEAQGDLSEHASSVLTAALELRTMVEDLTNMNLIYTGQRDIRPMPIVLQDIIQVACDEMASDAEAKGHQLILDLPEESIIVRADQKLKLVFGNVLNNAVRFMPEPGNIIVRLTATEDNALVEIQDNGIGIPPDKLTRIFEQFYQIEDHMTRRYGGLGLGLAIARVLVELHGGRIWAVSDGLGKGATFKIQLPLVT
ncbi:MAG: ATP-binding protein [Anaerolineales bacterium]|jgi:signal transduction histidine kinase